MPKLFNRWRSDDNAELEAEAETRRLKRQFLDLVCETAEQEARGWEHESLGYHNDVQTWYMTVSIPQEDKVLSSGTTIPQDDKTEIRVVITLYTDKPHKTQMVIGQKAILPLTKRERQRIANAFLRGFIQLAMEPLTIELAVDHALIDIEEWTADE